MVGTNKTSQSVYYIRKYKVEESKIKFFYIHIEKVGKYNYG
jgi:hypothetical protein